MEASWRMYRVAPAVGCAVFMSAAVLSAQSTWNGLRFGMTEIEVKQVLKSRATRPSVTNKSKREDKEYVGWEVYHLVLEDMYGSATIMFDVKSHRLSSITVHVRDPDIDIHALSFPDEDDHARIFAMRLQLLRDEISKKYGHPFLQSECHKLQTCNTTWRDKLQIVDMDVIADSVLIFYRLRESTPDL